MVGDIQKLASGTGSLSVMTNENGGIIDDTVITKVSETEVYMVLNAGCRDKDLAHITTQHSKFTGDVQITVHDDRSLLALQGPKAAEVLQPLVKEDLSKVYFSHFRQGFSIAGVSDCFLTRTGYATDSVDQQLIVAHVHALSSIAPRIVQSGNTLLVFCR